MHCELVVPALFAASEIPRLPALEMLLARGRAEHAEPLALEPWLARAFGLEHDALPAGALTALAAGEECARAAAESCWLRADPVHLRVGNDRVTLIPSAGFSLSREEADEFAQSLNLHFGGELTLVAVQPECWCLRAPGDVVLEASAPIELAGQAVGPNLPRGPDAPRWHALMNEIQMALHDHPVNLERERRGDPVVNSVWFWGAGRLPNAARGPWHSVTADETVAAGLTRLAHLHHRPLPAGASDWLDRTPEDGRHLVLLDVLRGAAALGDAQARAERLHVLEERWFAPLLEALRAGRIGMVTVRTPDSGMAYETARGDLRRFWRRVRPLSAYA